MKLENKSQLLAEMKRMIETFDWGYIDVYVAGVTPKPEMIRNPLENFESKVMYYDKAYNENLTLRANPKIKIVGFEVKGGKNDE